MPGPLVTGNVGMYFAAYRLSQMGWNVMPIWWQAGVFILRPTEVRTRSDFSTRALRQGLPDVGLRDSKLPCDRGRLDACFEGGAHCIQLASGQ